MGCKNQIRTTLALFILAFAVDGAISPLIEFATFTGPTTEITSIAVDSAGHVFSAGYSGSREFPCTILPAGPLGDGARGFIRKLSPRGDAAVWTVCFPLHVVSIAVDRAGAIHAVATGVSTTILTLESSEGKLVWNTPIVGANATALAVDSSGATFITGYAGETFTSGSGAYFAKLDNSGKIVHVSRIGTGGVTAIAVDSKGAVWVAGATAQSTTGPPLSRPVGSGGFVAKYDGSDFRRLAGTGYGGGATVPQALNTTVNSLSIDSADALYVSGSIEGTLPATLGVIGPQRGPVGRAYVYVMKLDTSGNREYATYIPPELGPVRLARALQDGKVLFSFLRGDSRSPCGTKVIRQARLNAVASQIEEEWFLPASLTTMISDRGYLYSAARPFDVDLPFVATANAHLTQYSNGLDIIVAKIDLSKPSPPQISCVLNAASLLPGRDGRGFDGSVAPREIVSIFGEGLPVGDDLQVTFDGAPAAVLYADARQINAVVPEFVSGSTAIGIRRGNIFSSALRLPVTRAVPGLFAVGEGPTLAVVPETEDVVSMYMTGEGDGLPIRVTVGGTEAKVLRRRQVSLGVLEVTFRIPRGLPPWANNVVAYSGDFSTELRPRTLAIR